MRVGSLDARLFFVDVVSVSSWAAGSKKRESGCGVVACEKFVVLCVFWVGGLFEFVHAMKIKFN